MKNKRYFVYIILTALLLLIAIGFILPQLNQQPNAAERQWLFRVEFLDFLGTAYAEYLKQPGVIPADKQKIVEFAKARFPAWTFDRHWLADFRNVYGTENFTQVFTVVDQPFSSETKWLIVENRSPEQQPLGITSGRQIFILKQLGLPENLNRHNMPKP